MECLDLVIPIIIHFIHPWVWVSTIHTGLMVMGIMDLITSMDILTLPDYLSQWEWGMVALVITGVTHFIITMAGVEDLTHFMVEVGTALLLS